MNDLTTKLRAGTDLSKEDVTAAVAALLDDGISEEPAISPVCCFVPSPGQILRSNFPGRIFRP